VVRAFVSSYIEDIQKNENVVYVVILSYDECKDDYHMKQFITSVAVLSLITICSIGNAKKQEKVVEHQYTPETIQIFKNSCVVSCTNETDDMFKKMVCVCLCSVSADKIMESGHTVEYVAKHLTEFKPTKQEFQLCVELIKCVASKPTCEDNHQNDDNATQPPTGHSL
jgi:hypothetical protein